MAINSKMTIEDYMKKASGRFKVIRQDLKTQKERQKDSSDFNGILSTFKKPSHQIESKSIQGLTLADYRSRSNASIYSKLSRQSPEDVQTKYTDPSGCVTAYKEASEEYQPGSENTNTQQPLSTDTANHGQIQPQSGLSNTLKLKKQLPTADKGLSQNRSTQNNQTIEKAINEAAVQYQLSPKLIKGVIQAESNYDANAVSPAGAQGLMQLMPGTAKDLGVKNPFDIKENVDGGVRYLKKMMDMFDGNIRQALSAYNAGPATVKRYNGNVPYRETRQYVDRVMDHTNTVI